MKNKKTTLVGNVPLEPKASSGRTVVAKSTKKIQIKAVDVTNNNEGAQNTVGRGRLKAPETRDASDKGVNSSEKSNVPRPSIRRKVVPNSYK